MAAINLRSRLYFTDDGEVGVVDTMLDAEVDETDDVSEARAAVVKLRDSWLAVDLSAFENVLTQ